MLIGEYMKKYGVIVGITLVILLIVILIIKLPRTNPEINNIENNNELTELMNKKIEHDKLTKISYSNSGDSNGNIDRITIDIANLTIETRYKANYSDPLEIKEYTINEDDLKDVEEYIEKNNFIVWSTLPIDRDSIVLDAPLKVISLTYDNTSIGSSIDTYSVDFNKKIPREGYPLLNNLVDKIMDIKSKAILVNQYNTLDEKK